MFMDTNLSFSFSHVLLIIHLAHGPNGTAAGKQTKAAVKTDNGVAAGQKTTAGRFGRR